MAEGSYLEDFQKWLDEETLELTIVEYIEFLDEIVVEVATRRNMAEEDLKREDS